MTDYLLDTNVISEAVRKLPNPNVLAWTNSLARAQALVSEMTIAELEQGVALTVDTAKQAYLRAWLDGDVYPFFDGRVLPIDSQVLQSALSLSSDGRRWGQTYAFQDLLIGATAAAHGLTVVTRNQRNFAPMGVALFDPWTDPLP